MTLPSPPTRCAPERANRSTVDVEYDGGVTTHQWRLSCGPASKWSKPGPSFQPVVQSNGLLGTWGRGSRLPLKRHVLAKEVDSGNTPSAVANSQPGPTVCTKRRHCLARLGTDSHVGNGARIQTGCRGRSGRRPLTRNHCASLWRSLLASASHRLGVQLWPTRSRAWSAELRAHKLLTDAPGQGRIVDIDWDGRSEV